MFLWSIWEAWNPTKRVLSTWSVAVKPALQWWCVLLLLLYCGGTEEFSEGLWSSSINFHVKTSSGTLQVSWQHTSFCLVLWSSITYTVQGFTVPAVSTVTGFFASQGVTLSCVQGWNKSTLMLIQSQFIGQTQCCNVTSLCNDPTE